MAQEVTFGVPFDFPLFLSGNFGELRSNHFHGGLDFKTQGVTGKPLLAIADGYISKVTVTAGGYGNALYITHDNGYTSVHGHLDRFLPEIARRVHEQQYAEQSYVVTLEFAPEEFPVSQGEVWHTPAIRATRSVRTSTWRYVLPTPTSPLIRYTSIRIRLWTIFRRGLRISWCMETAERVE